MRVLAVMAHPDDVDIWCGGTLLKYGQLGHRLSVVVVTNGRTGTYEKVADRILAERRKEEQVRAAGIYGAEVIFLDQDDGELFNDRETRGVVLDAVRRANPDIILTHSTGDQNVDHRTVGQIVTDTVVYLPLENVRVRAAPLQKQPMLFYCDTYAGIGTLPEAYVDVSEQFERKLQAVACHQSQLNEVTRWMDMVELQCRFRGMQSGHAYAESFTAFRIYGSMADFRALP